ncbi:Uncharacterized protein SCF082_LOCUS14676 [Durusdinium trenchii]|uniref:Uncharacterized protein n=1 Tax=Durusdinium trenchii TaxID=1381693 RepID=A0ABP0JZ89_9DINO
MAGFLRASWLLVVCFISSLPVRGEDACEAQAASGPAMLQRHAERQVLSSQSNLTNSSNATDIIRMVDACLQHRLVAAGGDEIQLARWDLVRTAEILSKLLEANLSVQALGSDWPDDKAVIDAALLAGRDAAEALAKAEFEAEAERILSSANLSQEAIQHFTSKIQKMAEMCGDSVEAHSLAGDEKSILDTDNMTLEEARIAKDIADYAEGLCQSDVLDLDFFVGQFEDESPECSALVSSSKLLQMEKHLSSLDFYAKSALVLHDNENNLGHHFSKKLQKNLGHSEVQLEPLLMEAVLNHGSSKPRMARLLYLERLYYDKVHGFTKQQYCESNFHLREEQPQHWISQSQEIQDYVDCVCVSHRPALWCDAAHAEPLALLQPTVVRRLQEAARKVNSLNLMQSGAPVGLGPCQDAEGKPAGFDCSLCVNGANCISASGSFSVDVFSSLKELLGQSSNCISGYCSPCMGVKPGDPFQFKLDLGVAVSKCGSTADYLASFHYFAELKMCIGGVLGEAADQIGWALCQSLGKLAYYPFISKLHFSVGLPIPLPPPIGVRASASVNLNLGDLTSAVYNHCSTLGPAAHFRCLEEFFAARGVTSVDFKIEVLLGVSIPFVGTVGKWIKVLGFGFAEHDNSRQIAMNKAGVTIVHIGASPWRQICGRAFSGVSCEPYAGDGDYRANPDCRSCGDDFSIWRADPANSRSVCIRRDDHHGGWGMNLEIACPVDNSHTKIIVPIGSSSTRTKCAMPSEPVTCRSDAGNQGVRLGFDTHGDAYNVYKDHQSERWCAYRTDHSGGWGQDLQLECDPTGGAQSYSVSTVHIGNSDSNLRCVLASHEYSCDAFAGDGHYRVNDDCRHCGDSFYISVNDGYVCADRTDYHGGWGLDLKISCKNYGFVRETVEINMGSSGSNEKCIVAPKPVMCASYAANRGYRRNNDNYGDAFSIRTYDHGGFHVCTRRTDYHGGWGMHLKFTCVAT